MNRYVALGLFVAASFLAALPGGLLTDASWYVALARPTWAPPGWLFGPVWTVLYLMIAVSGWLVWLRGAWASQRKPLIAFGIQLALNCAWTPIFFGAREIGVALVVIGVLLVAIAVNVALFWRVRRLAGALLVPYLLWVSFASALNFAIWRLN